MDDVDLRLDPNEASDLCPVFEPGVLQRRGWDRAYLTVLDEAPVERALALIVHERDAEPATGWHAIRVRGKVDAKGKTEDAEACAARDGWVYALGSQFGSKSGPLEARRSWIARVSERDLQRAVKGRKVRVELARMRFGLHRAINDALAAAAVELLPLGPQTREAYVDATIRHGAAAGKRWSGRVTSADHPVNVEACEFRSNGRLLLGLRQPVTAEGHPLLVELDDAPAIFDAPGAVPTCSHVWVLESVGSPDEPAGVRALHGSGGDVFHAIVGNLEATGKAAALLADHPEGAAATSAHVRFELPAAAAGGSVIAEPVVDFGDVRRVEGLAVDPDGRGVYVIDRDGRVDLRTAAID